MQRESGYYPPGAEFDPRAPWNQDDTAQEKRMERAEAEADLILTDGVKLHEFDFNWELWPRISWYTMAEIFKDLPKALEEDDSGATQRILAAIEKQRDALREYMAEKIEESMPPEDNERPED